MILCTVNRAKSGDFPGETASVGGKFLLLRRRCIFRGERIFCLLRNLAFSSPQNFSEKNANFAKKSINAAEIVGEGAVEFRSGEVP